MRHPCNCQSAKRGKFLHWRILLLGMAIMIFAGIASAANIHINIDFQGDSRSAKPNGFTSSGSGMVHFYDTVGAGLAVANAGVQGAGGRSLVVVSDTDGSGVEIQLDFLASLLELDFGNDDPNFTVPGDLAMLTVYNGATQVDQTSVAMNRDDIMNQRISIGGLGAPFFNRAIFAYTDAAGSPFTGPGPTGLVGLQEVVDNIKIWVPEPSTFTLAALGLIGLAGYRRQRFVANKN